MDQSKALPFLSEHLMKKYKKAIEDYSISIIINREYENSYLYRGLSFKNIKYYKSAMKDYN